MRPVYVVIWSVLLAATGYNLTRFWPRRRARPGLLLGQQEAAALRSVVDPEGRVAWPDVVRLVPWPELELAEGELVLGMPLLACLDPAELRELLLVAAQQTSVEDERAVRWALRVAHGDIGRPLVGRRPRLTWLTSQLTDGLRARAAQLDADLGNWAGACERAAFDLVAPDRGRDLVPRPGRGGVGADPRPSGWSRRSRAAAGTWRRSPGSASSSRVRTPPAG